MHVSCLLFFIFFLSFDVLPTQGISPRPSSLLKPKIKKKQPNNYGNPVLKVMGGIMVPMSVIGECMMYTYFVKATYQWFTHGKEVRSFFSKQPVGATYTLKVTIKRFGSSLTYKFKSSDPKKLILEANTFVTEAIQKNYPNNTLFVRVLLEPTIITRHGKVITLSPFYNLWDPKKGITTTLKTKFFSNGQSNSDQIFEAVQLFTVGSAMALTGPLIVAGLFHLKTKFLNQPTSPALPLNP